MTTTTTPGAMLDKYGMPLGWLLQVQLEAVANGFTRYVISGRVADGRAYRTRRGVRPLVQRAVAVATRNRAEGRPALLSMARAI